MADVHGLGDIGTREVDDDASRNGDRVGPRETILRKRGHTRAERGGVDSDVQKPRARDLDRGEPGATAQSLRESVGHVTRSDPGSACTLGGLGGRESAVTLEVGEIGSVARGQST